MMERGVLWSVYNWGVARHCFPEYCGSQPTEGTPVHSRVMIDRRQQLRTGSQKNTSNYALNLNEQATGLRTLERCCTYRNSVEPRYCSIR